MTLGMLSGSMSPNAPSPFQSLAGGTAATPFSGMDFSIPTAPSGLTGMTPDFSGADPFAAAAVPQSPLAMFSGAGGAVPDFTANFDWVSSAPWPMSEYSFNAGPLTDDSFRTPSLVEWKDRTADLNPGRL